MTENATGLKESVRRGVRWITLAVAASAVVQLVRIVVLARSFLGPDEFGLIALATATIFVVSAFSDCGTSSALFHRQDASREELSSVYWLNVAIGLALFMLFLGFSPMLSTVLGDPLVSPVLQALGVCFVFDGLATPLLILLKRDLNFRHAALAEAVPVLVGSAAMLALAACGTGVWSLVSGLIAQSATRATLAIHWGWPRHRMALRLSSGDLASFVRFGAFQMAERIVGRLSDRIGQFLLPRLAGTEQLGLYSVALTLANTPLMQILSIVGQAAMPVLSKAQSEEDRLRRGYFLAAEILMTITAPVFLGLLVIAPTLVPLILGEKWALAVPVFQIMCLMSIFNGLYHFGGALIVAKGRASLGFWWRLWLMAALVGPAYFGARHGRGAGLALAMAGVWVLALVPYYCFVVRELLGACLADFSRAIGVPLAMGVAMASVVAGVQFGLPSLQDYIRLLLEIAIGGLLYSLLLLHFRPNVAHEVLMVLPFGRDLLALWPIRRVLNSGDPLLRSQEASRTGTG